MSSSFHLSFSPARASAESGLSTFRGRGGLGRPPDRRGGHTWSLATGFGTGPLILQRKKETASACSAQCRTSVFGRSARAAQYGDHHPECGRSARASRQSERSPSARRADQGALFAARRRGVRMGPSTTKLCGQSALRPPIKAPHRMVRRSCPNIREGLKQFKGRCPFDHWKRYRYILRQASSTIGPEVPRAYSTLAMHFLARRQHNVYVKRQLKAPEIRDWLKKNGRFKLPIFATRKKVQ